MTRAMFVAAMTVVLGCGGAAKPQPGVGNDKGHDPMVTGGGQGGPPSIDGLELRLLAERAITIGFDIVAHGAHEAAVTGDVRMTLDNHVRWRVSGTFDGNPISIDQIFGSDAGAHLSEAVVLGWTRMGLLHNVAQLATGKGIEAAGGSLGDMIVVKQTAQTDDAVTLDLVVGGKPIGTAELELDSLGLPRARKQTVKFPTGDMTVEEHYGAAVPETIAADVFVKQ